MEFRSQKLGPYTSDIELGVFQTNIEDLYKGLSELGQAYLDEQKKYKEEIAKIIADTEKQVEEYMKVQSPYLEQLNAEKSTKEQLKALKGDDSSYFDLAKAYYSEQSKINNTSRSDAEKEALRWQLGSNYGAIKGEIDSSYLEKKGEEIGKIFSGTLEDIILDFDNFDVSMKNLTKQLMNSLLKDVSDLLFSNLFSLGGDSSVFSSLVNGASGGGIWGGIANLALGLFGKSKKHHSGGVIPTASYELGGTGEQLALLKGGERVLSPGENVEYEKTAQQSPIVYNNFNIKAWDSKDVQKYLLENKQLLHAITFEGIKNNNNHLRTIVRNA